MSLTGYGEQDGTSQIGTQPEIQPATDASLRFVPTELAAKCRKLLESHHGINGYGSLPDMIWQSNARDIIERNHDLKKDFGIACKSRGAKRADQLFIQVATTVVALEILARDFAGWGKRYPAAKRQTELLLGEILHGRDRSLLDMYLYPGLGIRGEFVKALVPSHAEQTIA